MNRQYLKPGTISRFDIMATIAGRLQVSPKKMAIPKIFGCGFPSQVPKLIYHRNCENDTDDRVWNWIDRY